MNNLYSEAQKLVNYIRSLNGAFTFQQAQPMNHIGGIITDCVLQVGHRWITQVKPNIDRIINTFPSANTISGLLNLLHTHGAANLINWKGTDAQKRFAMTVDFFHNEKVDTVSDLYQWLQTGNNRDRLISKSALPNKAGIPKINNKTADYYRVLVGIPDAVAIDTLLKDFMRNAGIQGYGYMKLRSIIQLTAQQLSNGKQLVRPIDLDKSIWEYQSKQYTSVKIGATSNPSQSIGTNMQGKPFPGNGTIDEPNDNYEIRIGLAINKNYILNNYKVTPRDGNPAKLKINGIDHDVKLHIYQKVEQSYIGKSGLKKLLIANGYSRGRVNLIFNGNIIELK